MFEDCVISFTSAKPGRKREKDVIFYMQT